VGDGRFSLAGAYRVIAPQAVIIRGAQGGSNIAPGGLPDNHVSLSLDRVWKNHAALMTVITIAAALGHGSAGQFSGAVQAVALIACVALLGVPHGALDHLAARPYLQPLFKRAWLPVFLTVYLSAALLVAVSWRFASVGTLVTFLVLSVYHFGDGDVVPARYASAIERVVQILWRGLAVIALPIIRHSNETARIFVILLPDVSPEEVERLVATARTVGAPLLVALGLAALFVALRPAPPQLRRLRLWDAFEGYAIAALFWVAPPLLAFLIYFCGWHSPRHALHLASDLGEGNIRKGAVAFLWNSLPLTAATLILAVLAYGHLRGAHVSVEAGLLRLTFYGLSALTLPHMVGIAWQRAHPLPRSIAPDNSPVPKGY